MDRDAVARAVERACRCELEALKPGNVHIHSGPKAAVADFETSAEILAQAVGAPDLTVGQRIYQAVSRTKQQVGHNTNLGIVLLSVPLAEAAVSSRGQELRAALASVLAKLDLADAGWAFKAITLANPAGLGSTPEHDVRTPPSVGLTEAMAQAASRDRIARQYVSTYEDIFELGLPGFRAGFARWRDRPWATASAYLDFLAAFPDSHVARKHGLAAAGALCLRAQGPAKRLRTAGDPNSCRAELLGFDRSLKTRGINPGTSADLTVATLLGAFLEAKN